MKILVPVKQIAVPDEDFELLDNAKDIDPDYLDYEMNEWDEASYEEALQIMEAHDDVEVVPVTVGPEQSEEVLRKCLAKGGERGLRIWDDSLENLSNRAPNVVGRILAQVIAKENADMVFTGAIAADYTFSQTGISIAAELGLPHIAVVSKVECTPGADSVTVRRELEGGLEEEITVQVPAVLTIQVGINKPRYASLRGIKQARAKPVEVLTPADLGLGAEDINESVASFRVRRMMIPQKGHCKLLEGTAAEQAAALVKVIKEIRGD